MITFRQFLTEIFDKPKSYEVYEKTSVRNTYRFPVKDNQWMYATVYKDIQPKSYELEFYRADDVNRNSTVEMTNTRDSFMVLSTVSKIFMDHFNNNLPRGVTIHFSADSEDRSRVSLYKKLATQMAKKLGGYVDVYGEKERDDYVKIYIRGKE